MTNQLRHSGGSCAYTRFDSGPSGIAHDPQILVGLQVKMRHISFCQELGIWMGWTNSLDADVEMNASASIPAMFNQANAQP